MITHTSPISGVAVFENWIATAGYDNQVILWDGTTGCSLERALHNHLVNQVTFSPCGKYLASASSDFSARIWSVPEMRLCSVLTDHCDDVEMVLFHPVKPWIATACRDHKARLFTLDGDLIQTFIGHQADVISVEWGKDLNSLITTGDDGTVRAWDLESGKQIRQFDLGGVETDTIVVLENGQICAGNDEGEIVVIDEGRKKTVRAHRSGVKRLKYDPERHLLLSLSYDRTMKLWKESKGSLELFVQTTLPPEIWPRSAAFFQEQYVVFGTFGTTYASFNYVTETWSTEAVAPTAGKNAVAAIGNDIYSVGDSGVVYKNKKPLVALGSLCNFLTPFGNTLLTGGQQGIVFDALTGETVYVHRSPLNCAAVFKRNSQLKAIVGSYTGDAIILGLEDQGRIRFEGLVTLHSNAIKGVSASERYLVSVCATGGMAIHSVDTYAKILECDSAHDKIANGCTWIEEEKFASVSRDLKLRIWNLAEESFEVISTPHRNSVKCVAATGKGRFVATGSYGGKVSVYDRDKKSWVVDERVTAAGISSLAANGEGFLASSYDGNVYSVNLKTGSL